MFRVQGLGFRGVLRISRVFRVQGLGFRGVLRISRVEDVGFRV